MVIVKTPQKRYFSLFKLGSGYTFKRQLVGNQLVDVFPF